MRQSRDQYHVSIGVMRLDQTLSLLVLIANCAAGHVSTDCIFQSSYHLAQLFHMVH